MINRVDYERLRKSEAVFLDNRITSELKEELSSFCLENSIQLYIIPSFADILIKKKNLDLNDLLIRKLCSFKLSRTQRFFKRTFDIIFSLIFLIILSPLMLAIYLLIKLVDRGPAVYLQKRLTYQGKEFILFKFRTMILDAEKDSGAVLSTENDGRVTKVGRFLRKTRLDEILQIFNVLIGDMAIVGPRPERKYFVDKFLEGNLFYKYRFQVKAGITGLAQISCFYNSDYENKLYFDLLYIADYSFLGDIKLIIRTLAVFFKKSSSTGIIQEDLETLINRKGKRMVEIKPGILELRYKDEKDNY
jgi:lipopolysaccharide/colanic/teichoic acid biosynthesis glycosyltransferase